MAAAAAGLGPRDQVVLDLHLRQGLEGQELGDAIGVSASHAYVLVSRLRDQVERSLGALLVARQGREDCPELAAVLDGWDGRFTPVWRKRVARHADGCAVCSDRRRRLLSPAGLLGVAPAFALPAGMRDRVLGELELCSYSGPPWPGGQDGFPPPLAGVGGRRRPALVAAILAALVLLGAGMFQVLGDDSSPPTEVATLGPVPTASTPSSSTVAVATSGSHDDDGGGRRSRSFVRERAARRGRPRPRRRPGDANPDPDPADPGPDPGPSATTTTSPRPTTTTRAPDTTPPQLPALTVTPGTIRAVTPCVIGSPRSATVTVTATDASGIGSVVLEVGAPASEMLTMAPSGGGTYTVVLGPYAGTANLQTVTVALTATATDRAGNAATRSGSFVLQCVAPTNP